MAWVVDGSNVLGALRWNRESRSSKERLSTLCARFARSEGRRVVLCFDGAAPDGFARKLGRLTVRFSYPSDADDMINGITRDSDEPWTVVTSDQALAGRVRRRSVEIVSAGEFAARLESLGERAGDNGTDGTAGGEDWENYFSDPNNRLF